MKPSFGMGSLIYSAHLCSEVFGNDFFLDILQHVSKPPTSSTCTTYYKNVCILYNQVRNS